MDNQTDVSIKFKNSVTGQKKLDTYVETLTKIKSVLGSIDKGAAQQIEQSVKGTKTINTDMDKMSKNFNLAFNYTALRTFARGLSKVVEGFTAMTTKSTSFLEDFNLFQVAFRGNYTEATKFVNKLSEMYGLDEDWLVKTTAQFKQLSNAMGLANETGEKVSKLMTELAIDISSLYNIDVDRASSVLQSALAGQTKPVRALGADITQASLQQTLDKLDISSQVADLSYAEKRLLIMVSLTQQLSGVTNDWGRTLESPSNQIRIMNEQWQRLQRNVGNIFMQTVGKILPYLNAVLMVLNEIAKIIAKLFGYNLGEFDYFDEAALGTENFADELDNAAESAEKLKHGLRGFDKLNVITTPNDKNTSGTGVGGINPQLLNAFNDAFDEYNRKLTDVEMKATKIRDKIMEWLGFTKQIDKETGEVSFKFDHITSGTVLGALAVGGTIFSGIKVILKTLNKIGLLKFTNLKDLTNVFGGGKMATSITNFASSLGMSVGTLGLVAAAIVAIGAALVYAYTHSDVFKEKVDTMVSSVITLFEDLYVVIVKGLKVTWEIVKPIWEDIEKVIVEVVKYCYDNIVYNFTQIIEVITGAAKIISDIIHGDFSGAFDDFKAMVGNLWENWKEHFNKMFDKVTEIVPKIVEKMGEILTWLGELPSKAGEKIGEFTAKIVNKIFETDWIEEGKKLIKNVCKGIKDIGTNLDDFSSKLYNKLKDSLSTVNWWQLGKDVMKAIINGLTWDTQLKNSFVNSFVKGIKESLKIHSPSRVIEDEEIGDNVFRAITFGMERQLPSLKSEAEDIVNTLNSGIKDATISANYDYDVPQFNANTILSGLQSTNVGNSTQTSKQSINPTIIVQVGNKEIAKQIITDLQDMAKDNGKPITIGG